METENGKIKSGIIKLWVDSSNPKMIYASEDEYALLEPHLEQFPVLKNFVSKVVPRVKEREWYRFRIALYYTEELDIQLFLQKPFGFFQDKLEGRQENITKGNRDADLMNELTKKCSKGFIREYIQEYIYNFINDYTRKLGQEFSPIIHIFQDESEREIFFDSAFVAQHRDAPRSRAIVDSSIWNYFLCSKNDLDAIRNTIYENYKQNYYDLLIAKEYADLNARIATMANLYEDPTIKSNSNSGGHAAAVSPFLFHSEQVLAAKREEEFEKNKDSIYNFTQHKWRALLVDDRIHENYLTPSDRLVSKENIIENRIEKILWKGCRCKCVYDLNECKDKAFSADKETEPNMVILCVDSLDKAKAALKNYKFDFILLDYLLDDHTDNDGNIIGRHYGYELLTDLADEKNGIGKDCAKDITPYLHYNEGKQYIVGPDHRYFFMFISAFTTAISERLRLFGFSRSEKLWHIAEGACPTNTPELFCYNLQKMMVKRIKDSGLEKLNPDKILKLTEKIFRKATDGKESVRKRANENYTEILSLLYHYNRVRQDIERPSDDRPTLWSTRGSVLMTAYFNDYLAMGGLLEHLAHLVHLTAFGTARQWSEMWEEYLYFKNQFTDLFNGRLDKTIKLVIDDQEQTITIRAALNKLYNSIGDYILELKKIN